MDDANPLVRRIVQDSLPTLFDHARSLGGLGERLMGARAEFVGAWKTSLQKEPSMVRIGNAGDLAEEGMQFLVEPLGQPDLEQYLTGISRWSEGWRARGTNLADSVCFLGTLRRACVPFLLRDYAAGPELELVFRGLDAWERAVLNVLAAAEIQALHVEMTGGAHYRTVGRLTGGMAHALNNTLAVIVGRSRMLEEQMTDEVQQNELRELQRIARAGAESVKRLQTFALEKGIAEPARLDVNAIITEAVQLTRFRWRDEAQASGIDIDVARELGSVPPVIGQAFALTDALVELILNSVEAMPMGGIATIRTTQVEDRVQIQIHDQGQGMDAVTLGRATDPFYTTKGAGHYGLGLTTVTTIVQEMGGTWDLASLPGQGTTATIELPVVRQIQQAAEYRPGRLGRWARILIVDDEPLVCDVMVRSFQLRGFQCVAANSGTEALRVFDEQGPFEVALVDLGMPQMNGFETAQAIKQAHPRTIVILMTGWSSDLDPRKMRETGVDRAISKPFDVDEVIQLISEALAIQDKM